MGPAYFVIAIMGCSDSGLDCRTAVAASGRYSTEQACLAATDNALQANSDLDFPTLVAHCLPGSRKASTTEPDEPTEGAGAA